MPTYNVIVKRGGKRYKYVVKAKDRETAEKRVKLHSRNGREGEIENGQS
jgi:hypothetical protein